MKLQWVLFVKLQVQWDGKANPNNNPSRADMLIKSTLLKNKYYLHTGAISEAVNGERYLEKIEFNLSRELFVTFLLSMPTGQYLLNTKYCHQNFMGAIVSSFVLHFSWHLLLFLLH